MPSFDAWLRLLGQQKLPVSVIVDISDERLKLTSGEKSLGDWPLDKLNVVSLADGFHLRLEDEEVVLTVSNPDEFFGCLRNGKVPEPGDTMTANRSISSRLKPTEPEEQYGDLRKAIDKLAQAMSEETVPPDQVFATWLKLLKELNRRHAQAQLPSALFIRLNTELLNLLPVPS